MTEYATIENPGDRLSLVVKANLKRVVEKRLNNDYDFLLVIVGGRPAVGSGKTVLASLACAYVSELTGVPFTILNIFFTGDDYKKRRKQLKRKSSLQFDEGEEAFYSRTATTKAQRDMILKFTQLRQQNYFIVICVPSLLLLEKYMRGIGTETRVDCIWRITVNRWKFKCYSGKTGKLQKIKIDRDNNRVRYPMSPDFVGYWKPILKRSEFWKQYLVVKGKFLAGKEAEKKEEKPEVDEKVDRVANSYTQLQAAKKLGIHKNTIFRWIQSGKIDKKYVFKDVVGRVRIDGDIINKM